MPEFTPLDPTDIMVYDVETCDVCGGGFDRTTDPRVEAECDSGVQDHDFEDPGEGMLDRTYCDVCGWKKIEHDLDRPLHVHQSCFLDQDDILVLFKEEWRSR